MSDVKLGQLVDPGAFTAVGRDAIHLAVAPVVAGEILGPGEHVGFLGGDTSRAYRAHGRGLTPVGIVDLFLTVDLQPGDRFYLCLYLGTVTSLRHAWTHPAFEPEGIAPIQEAPAAPVVPHRGVAMKMPIAEAIRRLPAPVEVPPDATADRRVAASVASLRAIAEILDIGYQDLLLSAKEWIDDEEWKVEHGSEHWRDTFQGEMVAEFWKHYEIVVGVPVPEKHRRSFFSCSC